MNETNSVSPLGQRMIEDTAARKLNPHTQRSHVYSCKRFADLQLQKRRQPAGDAITFEANAPSA
jgi:hypothetical protein